MAEKKSKSEYAKKRLAEKAASRRKMADEQKAAYDLRKKAAFGNKALEEDAYKVYRGERSKGYLEKDKKTGDPTWKVTEMPVANREGEFTAGPLSGGEARTYSRAKLAALREARRKKIS